MCGFPLDHTVNHILVSSFTACVREAKIKVSTFEDITDPYARRYWAPFLNQISLFRADLHPRDDRTVWGHSKLNLDRGLSTFLQNAAFRYSRCFFHKQRLWRQALAQDHPDHLP